MLALAIAGIYWLAPRPATATSGNSLTTPDSAGEVGLSTSLALDAAGNPVVSYRDLDNGDLKVLHCNDPNCTGGGESITTPDTDAGFFSRTALVLDSAGNPVVSYYHGDGRYLKVLHCNDPNCAGGDESITAPDVTTRVWTLATGMALDVLGNPVVSYSDINDNLYVLHCNDPNCAGGDESIAAAGEGQLSSLALDAAGNPVVSYGNTTADLLYVLHCGNPTCTAGNTIAAPDTLGSYTSLALDAAGNPVVAYYGEDDEHLRVLHCGNPACTAGNTIAVADMAHDSGTYNSLVLDSAGNPVVSYCLESPFVCSEMRVLHCGDPTCTAGNTINAAPDTGYYSSVALDAAGNPVVSYYDNFNTDLRIFHCGDPACSGLKPSTPTPCPEGKVPSNGGCGTPTITLTPTITPTPTPKDPDADTDGDTIPNSNDPNDDNDGCTDDQENGPDETLGGLRDPHNPWDFYDVLGPGAALPLDRVIDLPNDILGVIQHFSPSGAPPYDIAFDRGPSSGPNPWNMTAPDGVIDLPNDILGVIMQFEHSCQ